MGKARISVEAVCSRCGIVANLEYHNYKSIRAIKHEIKDWVWDNDYGNLCETCQEEVKNIKKKKKQILYDKSTE